MLRSAWFISFCGVVLGLSAFVFSQVAPAGKKYAILVGVNEYQHERLPNLKYAERDVEELAKILEPAGYKVTLLTGSAPSGKRRATKLAIETQIKEILNATQKGDIVLLAFAGHGLQFEDQPDAYFCPVDARPFKDEAASLVSLSGIYDRLNKSFAGMKVLLVDACRNEPGKRGVRSGIDADNAPRPPSGVAALFSCRAGEVAHESDAVRHGIFFHHVIEGLQGKAVNSRGMVTFASMADHVSHCVVEDVPKLVGGGARQSPNLKADYSTEPVLVTMNVPAHPIASAAIEAPKSTPRIEAGLEPLKGRETTIDLGNGVKMEFVRIPAGKFMMGSPNWDVDAFDEEKPQHEVRISKDFWLGKYPVTQEEYQQVIGSNPSHFATTGAGKDVIKDMDTKRFPVENATWDEAKEFCRKLTSLHMRKMQLPSEAQWEYACRAGTQTRFNFGNSCNGTEANCCGSSPLGTPVKGPSLVRTCRVGSYPPNAWGLFDMHANVGQFCEDYYDSKFYSKANSPDPVCRDSSLESFVIRGGTWEGSPKAARSACRLPGFPGRNPDYGFRVCIPIE